MELTAIFLSSITPPAEVQRMIDERSGLAAVGNLDEFFKFKAAKAMGDAAAATADGGASGAANGMGLGLGAGLGFMMPGMLAQQMKGGGTAVIDSIPCPKCGVALPAAAHFCSSCGAEIKSSIVCPGCKAKIPAGVKFCMHCGTKLENGAK